MGIEKAPAAQQTRKKGRTRNESLISRARQPADNQLDVLQHPSQASQSELHDIPVAPPPRSERAIPTAAATSQPSTSLTDPQHPANRHQQILSFLNDCTPEELLFISQTVTPLLKRDFVSYLPLELAFHILSFIDEPKTLTRASRVSRNWYRIVRDEVVWRRMCYIHGFNDWDEDKVEAMLERERWKARENGQGEGERNHRRSSNTFSFRRHFKKSYIIRSNWRNGGDLLSTHRLPIISPDNGTVTSLALDSDWVVVGLASSMIKLYRASTGVLFRTLVGHDSGVWGVCLVSKSDSASRSRLARKKKKKGGFQSREGEDDHPESSSRPSTGDALPRGLSDGTHVMPDESLEHLVPAALKKALGFDLSDSSDSNEASNTDDDLRRMSEAASDEFALPGQPQVAPAYQSARSRRKGKQHIDMEPNGAEEADEMLSSRSLPVTMSSSSRGWGQPHAIVVSGGCDKTLRVWDADSGHCIYVLHGHSATIRCIRVLDKRPIAVTGSRDSSLRVWNIKYGRCLRILDGHDQSVRCLDVSGNKVVSGSYDNTCRVWNIDTGECLHVLSGHYHQVYCVAFDGNMIASGGLDTTVRVWDAETGQCMALLQGHTALVCQLQLSFANNLLVTGGSDGRVITFSLSSYEPLHRLAAHDSSVTALQFDKDFLVTGGNDGRVRLYETQTGNFIREISEPSESVWQVAFIKELCAVMCKRAGKTVVELWSLGPKTAKMRRKARKAALQPEAGISTGSRPKWS